MTRALLVLLLVSCDTGPAPSDAAGPDAPRSDVPGLDAPIAPGTDAPVTPVDAPPMPTSGCGLPATPGTSEHHVMVGGVDRTFTVVVPATYDESVPHSLVLRFHGLGATGAAAVGGVGMTQPNIIVGPDTNPPGGAWSTSGDLPFVDAIVDALSRELCIDATRNFATGYSNGGFMAHSVGCNRPESFRGIAIQESGSGSGTCAPIGIYILHNTDDATVPISYGTGLRDQMLGVNGCDATSTAVAPAPCVSYDGCEAPLVWCNPPTGGHRPDYAISLGIGPFFDSL